MRPIPSDSIDIVPSYRAVSLEQVYGNAHTDQTAATEETAGSSFLSLLHRTPTYAASGPRPDVTASVPEVSAEVSAPAVETGAFVLDIAAAVEAVPKESGKPMLNCLPKDTSGFDRYRTRNDILRAIDLVLGSGYHSQTISFTVGGFHRVSDWISRRTLQSAFSNGFKQHT